MKEYKIMKRNDGFEYLETISGDDLSSDGETEMRTLRSQAFEERRNKMDRAEGLRFALRKLRRRAQKKIQGERIRLAEMRIKQAEEQIKKSEEQIKKIQMRKKQIRTEGLKQRRKIKRVRIRGEGGPVVDPRYQICCQCHVRYPECGGELRRRRRRHRVTRRRF